MFIQTAQPCSFCGEHKQMDSVYLTLLAAISLFEELAERQVGYC